MRTSLLFFLFATISLSALSQSHTFGTVSLSTTYDGGVQMAKYNQKYNGNAVGQEDTSGAITSMFRFDGHFNLLKFLSVGANVRMGRYIEDPENTQAQGNKLRVYAFSARLYPVNKDKFAWYAGPLIGVTKLEINKLSDPFAIPYQYRFKGIHFGLETGFNWYFAGNFGLNFGLGYSSQAMLLTEAKIDGDSFNLDGWENILSAKGAHVNIGLTYHFGGK